MSRYKKKGHLLTVSGNNKEKVRGMGKHGVYVFQCDVSLIRWRTPKQTEHMFVTWSCIRIKCEVSS